MSLAALDHAASTGPDAAAPPPPALPPEAKRWRDLRKRLLSALVLGPVALACVWVGAVPFAILLALCVAVLAWEWVHLCGLRTRALPGAAVPAAVFLALALEVADLHAAAWGTLALGFALAWAVAERAARHAAERLPDRPPQPALRLALGTLYIGVAGLCLIWLRGSGEAGRDTLVFLLAVVWATDVGAYLAGRALGGPRLWPAVSPGKTWSGAAGGLVAAVALAAWLAPALHPGSAAKAALVAVALSLATQGGDLLESAIKRHFKVKDTSSLIPGHGGLLDRLDGLLAAAPVAALVVLALGHGGPPWR